MYVSRLSKKNSFSFVFVSYSILINQFLILFASLSHNLYQNTIGELCTYITADTEFTMSFLRQVGNTQIHIIAYFLSIVLTS